MSDDTVTMKPTSRVNGSVVTPPPHQLSSTELAPPRPLRRRFNTRRHKLNLTSTSERPNTPLQLVNDPDELADDFLDLGTLPLDSQRPQPTTREDVGGVLTASLLSPTKTTPLAYAKKTSGLEKLSCSDETHCVVDDERKFNIADDKKKVETEIGLVTSNVENVLNTVDTDEMSLSDKNLTLNKNEGMYTLWKEVLYV